MSRGWAFLDHMFFGGVQCFMKKVLGVCKLLLAKSGDCVRGLDASATFVYEFPVDFIFVVDFVDDLCMD